MKKLLIDPGVCGFRTLVTATYNEDDDEVTLRVDTGCKHVREMMDTLATPLTASPCAFPGRDRTSFTSLPPRIFRRTPPAR